MDYILRKQRAHLYVMLLNQCKKWNITIPLCTNINYLYQKGVLRTIAYKARLVNVICVIQRVPVTARKVPPRRVKPSNGGATLHYGDNMDEVIKTIGIKLNPTIEQVQEINQLLEAFQLGINWSLKEIEKRYQLFLSTYQEIKSIEGLCTVCNTQKDLRYIHKTTGSRYCAFCAMKTYSQYTIRKEIYGTDDRVVENDLKDVIEIPVKTHYDSIFAQAYGVWSSYNGWRNKRLKQKTMLEDALENEDQLYLKQAVLIEQKAADLKRENPKMIWKTAKAIVTKEIYHDFSEKEQEEIARLHAKLMELRRLNRPIHFPELKTCQSAMIDKGFVKWEDGKLFMTLFSKGKKDINYFGKEYLTQYLPKMEDDTTRSNLTIKGGDYYLMYPLAIKIRQPPDIKECDTFVAVLSPTKAAVVGYDTDGVLNSVKFFYTGELAFAKRHFKEKRAEITTRKDPDEKMRKIRRRRKSVTRKGAVEQRYVSTYNHQLTRKMIDYVMEQSENPKLLIWNMGNGITQNFGKRLNYLKNLFPAVQQQDYLKHKAMQVSIPVIEVKYNKCNDLTCSSCSTKQKNGKKPAKVITQLIKNVKNFKCDACGYEINMLINQANNIKDNYRGSL